MQLETLLRGSGFNAVHVETIEQMIVFVSVLDCLTGENCH
jgi:hypothetical protein